MKTSKTKQAFTLVELLVVIAIIGILVGLLLPAIQAAREAARRTQCTNNLKQIGLAFHNYHDTYPKGSFPTGLLASSSNPSNRRGWAWVAYILPFCEMESLADALNIGESSLASGTNDTLNDTVLDFYLCPSDPHPEINEERTTYQEANTFYAATSNYVGNGGTELLDWPGGAPWINDSGANIAAVMDHHTGVLFLRSNVRIRDITDGTSNTLLVGERDTQDPHHGNHEAANWVGNIQPGSKGHLYTNLTIFNANAAGSKMIINDVDLVAGVPQENTDAAAEAADSWSSQHPGGAQFVVCDGSVQFLTETIDLTTFANLCSRNDGNPIGAY